MSGNTFGKIFTLTTFGESHGKALGCIIDGCPPGIDLSESDIQIDLDRRKPGQSKYTTQRKESDKVEILSGTFEGKTTGTPISLIIFNEDQRSKDYGEIKDKFRPGHADYTYSKKYGFRDYRGAGRSSARETVARVAGGAVAKKVLKDMIGLDIFGYVSQIGEHKPSKISKNDIESNPFFFPDKSMISTLEDYKTVFNKLRSLGISRILVESGVKLLTFFLKNKMINNLYIFKSSKKSKLNGLSLIFNVLENLETLPFLLSS